MSQSNYKLLGTKKLSQPIYPIIKIIKKCSYETQDKDCTLRLKLKLKANLKAIYKHCQYLKQSKT